MDWKGWGIKLLAADMILLNLGMGYIFFKSEIQNSENQTNKTTQSTNTYTYLEVDNKLAKLREEILAEVKPAGQSGTPIPPTVTPVPTYMPVRVNNVPTSKSRTVSYVPIPGQGSSTEFNWKDLPGTDFYFDRADYPGLLEAYFEASINLFNGNGRAYVRLFDVTHGIGVQGSDTETESQATVVAVSGNLGFWNGRNLYRVQAKTLTADTAIYSSGRLKLITEN